MSRPGWTIRYQDDSVTSWLRASVEFYGDARFTEDFRSARVWHDGNEAYEQRDKARQYLASEYRKNLNVVRRTQ